MPLLRSVSSLTHLCAEALGCFIARCVLPSTFLCTKSVPSLSHISEKSPPRDGGERGSSSSDLQSSPTEVSVEESFPPNEKSLPGDSTQYKILPGLTRRSAASAPIPRKEEWGEHVCGTDCEISNQNFKEVEEFLLAIVKTLTSHSHMTLHLMLLHSILPKLNAIYMKQLVKRTRSLIRSIVPMFINHNITEFDFASFKMLTEASMFKEVFSQLCHAVNLEVLIFGRSCYWRSKTMTSLNKILAELQSLRILHIHYVCSPQMLKDISQTCPNLTELSLKGSNEITDNEVGYLAYFKKLETLDISATSITGKGCSSILSKLPGLVWLTHCPFNCNSDTIIFESRAELFNYIKNQLRFQLESRASGRTVSGGDSNAPQPNNLQNLLLEDDLPSFPSSSIEEKQLCSHIQHLPPDENEEAPSLETSDIVLNFRKFWLFNPSSKELVLILLCPKIEHLQLDFVMQDMEEEPETSVIKNLPSLTTLVLNIYDRCPIDLVTSIVESASKLTYLNLHLGDDWFFIAPIHNILAQNCPHLKYLSMAGDYKGEHPLEESDSRLDFSLPTDGHRHLKEVHLAGCVSDQRLLHLLLQAPAIESLHFDGELEWLYDEAFSAAILTSRLSHLKVLWFNVSTSVTLLTIKKLLQGENQLQRVGRLCLMASASKPLYQELLLFARKNNLVTELIWVTDQRELKV